MMSYCTKCGAEIIESSKFCPYCGNPVFQRTSAESVTIDQQLNNDMDQRYDSNVNEVSYQIPKMKWFKFLIYGYLFLCAASGIFNAISYCFGLYINDTALYYSTYPGMQALNIIFGIYYAAYSVMAIVARQQLARYKKNGPDFYIAVVIIMPFTASLLYTIISSILMGGFVIGGALYLTGSNFAIYMIIELATEFAYIAANMIYFNKRKNLFRN